METKYIDHLFLELSQFTQAKTKREIQLERIIKRFAQYSEKDIINNIINAESHDIAYVTKLLTV